MSRHPPDDDWRVGTAVVTVITVLVATAVLFAGGSTVAAAANNTTINDTAPYYDNDSSFVDNGTWFQDIGSNASAESMLDMVVRIGPAFIGSGDVDPSETGYTGTILTGLVIGGVAIGAMGTVGVGPVGGSVLGLVVGYALTSVGLAPAWMQVLLLFGIGLTAAVAALRVLK